MVQRATEVTGRARPARHIHPDGVVRYYDRKEAAGARIVRQVDKGRLAGREVYIMHENIIEEREVIFYRYFFLPSFFSFSIS